MINSLKVRGSRLKAIGSRLEAQGPRLKAQGSRLKGLNFGFCHLSFAGCLLLVACSLFLSSCGYTTKTIVNVDFKTICVVPFVNKVDITSESSNVNRIKSYYPLLERDITNAVVNKLVSDGNLRLAKEDQADCVLSGELIDYRRDALSYNIDNQTVLEYRINLVVNMKLWDNKQNKLRWEENGFTGESTYYATGAAAKSENSAINDALVDLSRRIISRVVEEW